MKKKDTPIYDALAATSQTARAAEVSSLIERLIDDSDPYDGHHGNDRSDASVEYADATNPELAERLRQKIATGAKE